MADMVTISKEAALAKEADLALIDAMDKALYLRSKLSYDLFKEHYQLTKERELPWEYFLGERVLGIINHHMVNYLTFPISDEIVKTGPSSRERGVYYHSNASKLGFVVTDVEPHRQKIRQAYRAELINYRSQVITRMVESLQNTLDAIPASNDQVEITALLNLRDTDRTVVALKSASFDSDINAHIKDLKSTETDLTLKLKTEKQHNSASIACKKLLATIESRLAVLAAKVRFAAHAFEAIPNHTVRRDAIQTTLDGIAALNLPAEEADQYRPLLNDALSTAAEAVRVAEEARIAAEAVRAAEEARVATVAQLAEAAEHEKNARLVVEAKLAAAEARLAELERVRLAAEAEARAVEAARVAAAATAERERLAELERVRLAAEARVAAEAVRIAEEARVAAAARAAELERANRIAAEARATAEREKNARLEAERKLEEERKQKEAKPAPVIPPPAQQPQAPAKKPSFIDMIKYS